MPSYRAELREARASVRPDWTGFHSMPFRGGALAPAGKPQPVFHAGSYLTSNSFNVAQAVVQELQRLWKEVGGSGKERLQDPALASQSACRQRVGSGS